MSLRFRVAPEAEIELSEAAVWYEERQPGLGAQFLQAVHSALQRLADLPLSAPLDASGFRRLTLTRFPHKIFYRFDAEVLYVLRVRHAAQLDHWNP